MNAASPVPGEVPGAEWGGLPARHSPGKAVVVWRWLRAKWCRKFHRRSHARVVVGGEAVRVKCLRCGSQFIRERKNDLCDALIRQ